jgi:hypothetical protein
MCVYPKGRRASGRVDSEKETNGSMNIVRFQERMRSDGMRCKCDERKWRKIEM